MLAKAVWPRTLWHGLKVGARNEILCERKPLTVEACRRMEPTQMGLHRMQCRWQIWTGLSSKRGMGPRLR